MPEGTEEPRSGIDGYLFQLIATFEAAAMQQLGKIAHPVTGDVEVNLEGARLSIEMLDMVRRKTEGNLNHSEKHLLEHVLYQLRMNYVDVSKADEEPRVDDAAPGTAQERPQAEDAPRAPSDKGPQAGEAGPDSAGEEQRAGPPEGAEAGSNDDR